MWWGAGVVSCLKHGADLHIAQLMPLPLTVSCFSKIQKLLPNNTKLLPNITFLVLAHLGSPRQRAVKWVCVCVCSYKLKCFLKHLKHNCATYGFCATHFCEKNSSFLWKWRLTPLDFCVWCVFVVAYIGSLGVRKCEFCLFVFCKW